MQPYLSLPGDSTSQLRFDNGETAYYETSNAFSVTMVIVRSSATGSTNDRLVYKLL